MAEHYEDRSASKRLPPGRDPRRQRRPNGTAALEERHLGCARSFNPAMNPRQPLPLAAPRPPHGLHGTLNSKPSALRDSSCRIVGRHCHVRGVSYQRHAYAHRGACGEGVTAGFNVIGFRWSARCATQGGNMCGIAKLLRHGTINDLLACKPMLAGEGSGMPVPLACFKAHARQRW